MLAKILALGINLLIGGNSWAADRSNLLDIRSFSDKDAFVVELKFDKPVSQEGLSTDYIKETIQVNIPNGFLAAGLRSAKISNGQVDTLYTYQADKNTLRNRIIMRKGLLAEKFKGGVAVIPDGNFLRIRVVDSETKTAAQILDAAPVLPQALKSEIAHELKSETPPMMTATTETAEVRTAAADTPAPVIEESKIPVLSKGKAKFMKSEYPLKNLVVVVAAIAAFALLMFFVGKQWIKIGRKNIKANQIKVITQHYLAPRKSLAIIRVAGESILIGITDNAITPIKTLSLLDDELPEELPPSFSGSMRQVEEAEPKYSLPESKADKMTFSSGSARGVRAYANNSAPVKRDTTAISNEDDEYSVKGIRDLVKSKLKDMRTI
ncbi:MAG: hypothetical protein A4S09_00045 [Proteobacteria bacterium SG_bin7]|nr:MAG: hypothetical protein A4S09_00045 [Proteobacteria bacterium SG_bin7]